MFKRLGKGIKKFGKKAQNFTGMYKMADDFPDALGRTVRRNPPKVSKIIDSATDSVPSGAFFRGSGVGSALNRNVYDSAPDLGKRISERVGGGLDVSRDFGESMSRSARRSAGSIGAPNKMIEEASESVSRKAAKETAEKVTRPTGPDFPVDSPTKSKYARNSMTQREKNIERMRGKMDEARDVLNNVDIHSDADIRNARTILGKDYEFKGASGDDFVEAANSSRETATSFGKRAEAIDVEYDKNWKSMGDRTIGAGQYKSGADPKSYKPRSEYDFGDGPEGFLGSDRVRNYMGNRYDYKVNSGIDDLAKARGTISDDAYSDMIDKFNDSIGFRQRDGVSSKRYTVDRTDLINNLKEGKFDEAKELLGKHKAGYVNDANAIDAAFAYKVPQVGLGALGTAAIVSNMSSSKGQQSNAELYGQQTPYG